jgi:hypothetical protein
MKRYITPYLTLLITALLSMPPLCADGNFTVKIVNNTGDPAVKVYVLVKGLNPNTKKPTFIKFVKGTPVGVYADISTPDADINNPKQSLEYGYDYTDFKEGENEYVMHLPYLESGRVYISLNEKLKMPIVGKSPNLGIADPSAFNTSDPSYNLLYDKVEFTYLPINGSQTVINPTAVDCLALPIIVSQKKLVNGKEEQVVYGIQHSREKTFNDIEAILKAPGNSPEWARLVIRNGKGEILRIVAPGRDDAFFDPKYLSEYIDALWTYYKTHDLSIDCSELKNIIKGLESYTFTGRVNDKDIFEFKNKPTDPKKEPAIVNIAKPESKHFFLASQGPFEAANNTIAAVLVRNICSAWSVGLLPSPEIRLKNGTTSNMLCRDYFEAQKNAHNFYKDNTIIPTTGNNKPWYNLYAKAIHAVSKDIYAWAYDDAIGLDGTNFSTDKYPATLTIGPLTEKPKVAALSKVPKTKDSIRISQASKKVTKL